MFPACFWVWFMFPACFTLKASRSSVPSLEGFYCEMSIKMWQFNKIKAQQSPVKGENPFPVLNFLQLLLRHINSNVPVFLKQHVKPVSETHLRLQVHFLSHCSALIGEKVTRGHTHTLNVQSQRLSGPHKESCTNSHTHY